MKRTIIVELMLGVIASELIFHVAQADINRYIDHLDSRKKVQQTFNFLSQAVDVTCRDAFNAITLDSNNVPKGSVVMNVFGTVFQEFDAEVSVEIKKPVTTAIALNETNISN